MDPVVIRKPDPKRSLDFYDAKEVFDRARLARAFKKYRECVQLFTIVVVEFPNSKYAFPAFYNRGLCHESLDDPHAASLDFEAFIRKSTQSADRLDGQFRLLHNLVEISHENAHCVQYLSSPNFGSRDTRLISGAIPSPLVSIPVI